METFSQIKTKLLSKNPKYTFPFGIYASKEAYAYAHAYAYYAFAYIFTSVSRFHLFCHSFLDLPDFN